MKMTIKLFHLFATLAVDQQGGNSGFDPPPKQLTSDLFVTYRKAVNEIRGLGLHFEILKFIPPMPLRFISKHDAAQSRYSSFLNNPLRYHILQQIRQMTKSKRVQDRSKKKRVHDLEVTTEKWKIFSKIHFLMELLKSEPEHVMPIRSLERYRCQINLPRPHKLSDFLRKSPKLFELCQDRGGTLWVGMTDRTEELIEEEERQIEAHSDKAAEHVTRFLMMSVDKRLRVDKIAHFRRDLGLPLDFRAKWVHQYPDLFRLVKSQYDEMEYLELVDWKKEWAITELEKKAEDFSGYELHCPGLLSLPFPMKFPRDYKQVCRYRGKIDHFQKRQYLSPYADARGLQAGSQEFDKRGVAVMHELLSFTLDKRIVTDHLTHFRREFMMPQKLMRLLLKHFGIFYVSERGKRFHVFLNEAYEGSELIEKTPLVLWKEKVSSLIGYRGRKKRIETFEELSDVEDKDLFENDVGDEKYKMELEQGEKVGGFDGALLTDDAEMDLGEIRDLYTDS